MKGSVLFMNGHKALGAMVARNASPTFPAGVGGYAMGILGVKGRVTDSSALKVCVVLCGEVKDR